MQKHINFWWHQQSAIDAQYTYMHAKNRSFVPSPFTSHQQCRGTVVVATKMKRDNDVAQKANSVETEDDRQKK